MGYAMFAARKVMLTNQINVLGLQQIEITNERMKLTRAATAVADNKISADDYASLQGLGLSTALDLEVSRTSKYTDPNYYAGLMTAEKEARQKHGMSWMANIGGAAVGAGVGAWAATAAGLASGPVGWIALGVGALGAIIGNQLSAKTRERNKDVQDYKDNYDNHNMQDMNVEVIQKKIAEM